MYICLNDTLFSMCKKSIVVFKHFLSINLNSKNLANVCFRKKIMHWVELSCMTWGSRPSLENSNLINSQGKITQNTCRPHTQVKHLLPEILSTYATQTGLCIFRSNLHQCCPLFFSDFSRNKHACWRWRSSSFGEAHDEM